MFVSILLAVAAGPVAPVIADRAAPVTVVAITTAPPATVQPVRPTRYCFRGDVTGSRIPRKSCDTRKGWEAQGVDLDAALAGR